MVNMIKKNMKALAYERMFHEKQHEYENGKAISVTGCGGPQDCETPSL
jgi:hypothetical protein